jgi:AdoMet-dependent heme synthase
MAGGLERLQARAMAEHIPLYVTFELTLRCNLRCVHCYNFDRAQPLLTVGPRGEPREELRDEEILRILDELHDEGCLFLVLSGGEALSHPRLLDFVAHAAGRGMVVTVKSNGTLIDAPMAATLVQAGCSEVDVSVYGA